MQLPGVERDVLRTQVGRRKNGNNTFYLNMECFVFLKVLPHLSQISLKTAVAAAKFLCARLFLRVGVMCYLGRRRCCYHLPCTEGDTKAPRELASSGGAGRALWFSDCSWGHGRSGGYVTRSGPLTWGLPGVPSQASGFLAWGFFLEIPLPLRTKYLNQGARLWLEISSGCLVFLHFCLCHWRLQDAPADRSDLGFEGSVLPGQPAVGSADTVPSILGTNQPSCSTPGIHSRYLIQFTKLTLDHKPAASLLGLPSLSTPTCPGLLHHQGRGRFSSFLPMGCFKHCCDSVADPWLCRLPWHYKQLTPGPLAW